MAETKFQRKVYALCRQVPHGKVTTYKAIAEALGIKSYRAIGQALNQNPHAPAVPCHRVIAADGSLGGFRGKCSGKSLQEKMELLQGEGVLISNRKIDLQLFFFDVKKPR